MTTGAHRPLWRLFFYLGVSSLILALLSCGGGGGSAGSNQGNNTTADTPVWASTSVTPYSPLFNYAAGDINGDGLEDVIVSGWIAVGGDYTGSPNPGHGGWSGHYNPKMTVRVLIQQSDGRLRDDTAQWINDNQIWGSNRVLIADLDGDGGPDIVLPGFQDTGDFAPVPSVIYWHAGDHYVRDNSALPTPVWAHGGCLLDIDQDGRLDILMGTGTGGVWHNQGGRNFVFDNGAIDNAGASCTSDINPASGQQMVVSGNNYSNDGKRDNIYRLSNNGQRLSSFGLPGTELAVDTDDTGLLLVDIDGDGLKDLVVSGIGPSGKRRVYRNTGDWSFVDYSSQWLVGVDTLSYNQVTSRTLTVKSAQYVFLSGAEADTVFSLSEHGLTPVRPDRFVSVARQISTSKGFSYAADDYQSGFVYQSTALGGFGLLAPVHIKNTLCPEVNFPPSCTVMQFYSAQY